MLGIWPAILVAGVPFAVLQFLVSNLHGPWLVDVVASIASMAALVLFLRVWRPRDGWDPGGRIGTRMDEGAAMPPRAEVIRAWIPWIILSVLVFVWGLPHVKGALDAWTTVRASRSRAAQPRAARAARRARARARDRRLRAVVAVRHRHRHPRRGDRRRAGDGVLAAQIWRARTGARYAWCARRC